MNMPKKPIEVYLPDDEDTEKLFMMNMAKNFITPIKAKITRVGTSTGIIIPKQVLEYLGFKIGDKVYVYLERRNGD